MNCGSISHGGEDDSTGLRTQTATITPRTRCVPPEALISAATAKTKSAETGGRLAPRFGFCTQGTPIFPPRRAGCTTPFSGTALLGKKCELGGLSFVIAVAALQNFFAFPGLGFLFLCGS